MITVDPATFVISVPRDDLAIVQLTPTEIRTMDLNWFRMQLHDLMDDEEGMPLPKMFEHNTEVVLGGLTYARIIELLDPYSVTFEDGQYAVDLTGANSNVADKTNVNQVSVRPQNSAGLISSADIEYSAFNGGITYDEINGYAGTGQISNGANIGTPRAPSNNAYDARMIGYVRGFTTGYIIGDMNVPEYEQDGTTPFEVTGFTFIGSGKSSTTIDIPAMTNIQTCKYYDAHVTGTLDGFNTLVDCYIDNLNYIKGYLESCVLSPGIIVLGGNDTAHFLDCFSGVPGTGTPTIDFGGSGQALAMRNYNGGIKLINKNGTESASIDLNSGQVKIDLTTVTNGTIVIRGIGKVIEATTGEPIITGYYGDLYVLNEAMNQSNISAAVWDEPIEDHLIAGTTGRSVGQAQFAGAVHIDVNLGISGTTFPRGTQEIPSNNVTDALAIASANNIDVLRFHDHYTFTNSAYMSDFRLIGEGLQKTTLTFETGCILANCTLEHVTGTGNIIGVTGLYNCLIYNLNSATPYLTTTTVIAKDCIMQGTTTFPVLFEGTLEVLNCWGMPLDGNPPILDMGGANFDIDFRNYAGFINIKNCTADDAGHVPDIRIMITSGGAILESTVETGNIIVSGTGTLEDNSTSWTSLNTQGLMSQDTVAQAVWDQPIQDHLISGTTGLSLGIEQFDGVISLSTTGVSGTEFPIGTPSHPVNNMADAITIATSRGIKTIKLLTDFTLTAADYHVGYNFVGQGLTVLTCEAGCILPYCTVKDLTLTGYAVGIVLYDSVLMKDYGSVSPVPSTTTVTVVNSTFQGTVSLPSNFIGKIYVYDSYCVPDNGNPPILDMGGGDFEVQVRNMSGLLHVKNSVADADIRLMFTSGGVILDPSVTGGNFIITGVGTLTDNSTSVDSLDTEGLMSKATISEAVWDEPIINHLLPDTTGHQLYHQAYSNIVHVDVINGIAGVDFPTGTTHQPCNNLDDALLIASTHYMSTIHVVGALEIDGQDLTGYIIAADSSVGNTVTITSMINTGTCYFQDLTISGALSGSTRFTTSVLGTLTGFNGGAKNCLLTGDVEITGSGANYFTECDTYVTGSTPKNISVGDNYLNIIKCRGNFSLSDYTGTSAIAADFVAGNFTINNTCVSGMIGVSGLVTLNDNSGAGCTVVDNTVTEIGTANEVWEYERTP